MVKEEQLKVLALKHASSTSSITQSADIGRQFAIIKQTSKKATSVNLPSGFGLKGTLEDKLIRLQANKTLLLKTPMRKAIIDHITSCPEIFGNAMQPKITKKGFFENGMIDTNVETYPDIIKMMRTCKLKDFRQEHEDIIFNNFSELYNEMKNTGQVSEETYNRIGLPKDTNYAGEEVRTYLLSVTDMDYLKKNRQHLPQPLRILRAQSSTFAFYGRWCCRYRRRSYLDLRTFESVARRPLDNLQRGPLPPQQLRRGPSYEVTEPRNIPSYEMGSYEVP